VQQLVPSTELPVPFLMNDAMTERQIWTGSKFPDAGAVRTCNSERFGITWGLVCLWSRVAQAV
jgi:hypothetical protein